VKIPFIMVWFALKHIYLPTITHNLLWETVLSRFIWICTPQTLR